LQFIPLPWRWQQGQFMSRPPKAQPVSQAPTGNAVPVTAANFNRAETDMYFGAIVKDRHR
jgi:hypothetical protein